MNRKESIKQVGAVAGAAAFGLGCPQEAEAKETASAKTAAVSGKTVMKSIECMTALLVCSVLVFAGGCGEAEKENAVEKANPTFLQLAKDRFSVRYYAKTPVEQEKINAILEAARVAPTAKNLQPFHIYVLKSQEAIAKINTLSRCAYGAPVVFIVCYDKSRAWVSPFDASDHSGVMDSSIVGAHMMLEAFEQGLGSCWVKFFNPKEVSAAFDIPDNLTPSILLDVGYPQQGVAPSKLHFEKRDIKDLTTYK